MELRYSKVIKRRWFWPFKAEWWVIEELKKYPAPWDTTQIIAKEWKTIAHYRGKDDVRAIQKIVAQLQEAKEKNK